MAKRNREQAVREKRELKLAKKHAAAIARNAPPEEVELFGPLAKNNDSPALTADADSPEPQAEAAELQEPPTEGVTDVTPRS